MNPLKTHSMPIFLIIIPLILAMIGSSADEWLQYNRSAIIDGQWWRLISGHLLHMGWIHLLLNHAALLIIWYFSWHYLSNRAWWGALFFCSISLSLALFMLMPELRWYVGLSGVLHGLLAAGAVAGVAHKSKESILLLVLICIKVIWEQFAGALSSHMIVEGKIIINAHLYGMISGVIYATILQLMITIRSRLSGQSD